MLDFAELEIRFPFNWFWIVAGDESQFWSSEAAAYIAPDSAEALEFLAVGALPTRIQNEGELAGVLARHGMASPIAPTLNELRASAKQAVISFAEQIGAQLTAEYPRVEQQAWDAKLAEAKAIVAGETDPTNYPVIAAEISVTVETATDVAPIIIGKAALFETASGLISGFRQKTFATIDAASDQTEIDSILVIAKTTAETQLAALLA